MTPLPTQEEVEHEIDCQHQHKNFGSDTGWAIPYLHQLAAIIPELTAYRAALAGGSEVVDVIDFSDTFRYEKMLDLARTLAAANKVLRDERNELQSSFEDAVTRREKAKAERDQIAAQERERCAKVCVGLEYGINCIDAIRALAQKEPT